MVYAITGPQMYVIGVIFHESLLIKKWLGNGNYSNVTLFYVKHLHYRFTRYRATEDAGFKHHGFYSTKIRNVTCCFSYLQHNIYFVIPPLISITVPMEINHL